MSNQTEFHAIAATELRDVQGEILNIAGADISELEAGRGIINDNHSNKMPDVIGRITYAKKIMKESDCVDDTEKDMWLKIKSPLIYVRGKLFDDEDHRSAKAAAAILKVQHREDSPLKLKCSVEGGVISRGEKDSRLLSRTKIKALAFTFSPANNSTLVEGMNLTKSYSPSQLKADYELISEFIPFSKQEAPAFIEAPEYRVRSKFEKINNLMKALTAGYGGGSPTSATGGQVLQTESLDSGKSFRYIDCEHCGKEQPYLKYQVKCRNCGKSFAFDSLAKFFLSKTKVSQES